MTGFNHGLTGAVIALSIKQPALALPLAFASHFVCDAFPHFGLKKGTNHQKQIFKIYSLIDLLLILVLGLTIILITGSWVVLAGFVLAGSPDFVWFYRYYIQEKEGKNNPKSLNKFRRFHVKIQWSETVWPGLLLETLYASVMLIIFTRLI